MHPSSSLAFLTAALLAASAALLPACSDGASSSNAGAAGTGASAGSAGTGASAGSAGTGASAGSAGAAASAGSAGASAGSGGGGSGGSPSGGSGPGGTGGSSGDDIAALSDTFDGASLDQEWQIFNPGAVNVNVSGGSLRLTLTKAALWYQASQGVLVYKSVTGDFKVTSKVHAHRTSDATKPPAQPIQLGGLMARNPAAPPENYVFIVVGYDENDLSVETKSTTNNDSKYIGPTWPSAEAELRLCRVGIDFVVLKRAIGGGAWTEAAAYERGDLPATLQVGPNIYSLNQPDLTVDFDEVTFAKVSSLADCSKD